jgi:hypothetical protein
LPDVSGSFFLDLCLMKKTPVLAGASLSLYSISIIAGRVELMGHADSLDWGEDLGFWGLTRVWAGAQCGADGEALGKAGASLTETIDRQCKSRKSGRNVRICGCCLSPEERLLRF